MCGIAGELSFNGATPNRSDLASMAKSIAHRGPDGEGFFAQGAVGLAHRRLAIIDLSDAAAQPFSCGNGRYFTVYNGEIYNYKELRTELMRLGIVFKTQSDTEVVLQAFIRWGEACVSRFNGMFALAIWDVVEQKLFLARDRYGIKPLYFSLEANRFLFASEPKAILAHSSMSNRLDTEGLIEYLTFQNFFTDRTLYKGIRTFPAGHMGLISLRQRELAVRQYWDFNFSETPEHQDPRQQQDQLRGLLETAVKRQMVSDVEIGAYLSGGIDSGAITSIAASHEPYLKSFTCGFDLHSVSGIEIAFDERERAEHMSYLYKTEHYEMVLKSGDMERVMPGLMHHMDEPRVGQSYPNYYVARLASKFVKVVLTGTGGDELFGGYPWRYFRADGALGFDQYIDNYYAYWQRLVPPDLMPDLLAPVWNDTKHIDTKDIFRGVFNKDMPRPTKPEDYINHSLHFEAKTFLHGLLVVEDKLSMAHGLESRVPFLDNDLVDFAMRLPVNSKIGALKSTVRVDENAAGPKGEQYFQQTRDGKLVLREAVSQWMPKVITQGAKQGFSAPDATWFRGDSIEYVKRCLLSPNAKIHSVLNPAVTKRLIDEHLNGSKNRRLLIWSLLCLEHSDCNFS